MDWYLDADDVEALRSLRHEVSQYLARHAEEGADVWSAELAFDELVSNAVEHAQGSIWVSLEWQTPYPRLTVHDLGPGFEPRVALPDDVYAEGGRGLFLVSHLTRELEVAAKQAGGSKVSVVLDVRRPREPSLDPPRSVVAALPLAEEADDEGAFGKESFLRALVVQLARTVELQHGPAAAEAAVAQVGADVGSRMEEAYRAARQIEGALSPEQMGDLYVRLKHAIDGDFYVIEATDERIVLGNRACPFGDVVQRAPHLCRMTSSVFGGIAARNTGEALVQLEERIALGDPECRVVVWLRPPTGEVRHAGHGYGAAEPLTDE